MLARRYVPSPETNLADLLASLADGLAAVGARWYLFGAQATVLWGRPRLTADVDVTVRLDLADVGQLVDVLRARGFEPRIGDIHDFVRRTRVVPFTHVPSALPVDVVLAGPGLEERFLNRAVMVRVGDLDLPVISPEDLVITKILAGRPKDLDDVRGVLRERLDSLDVSVIRSTLTELEDALSRSDLLPCFESQWARARTRAR